MFEMMTSSLLGPRTDPPADIPPDALPDGVVFRTGRLIPWLGGLFAGMKGPAAAVTLGRTIVINPRARLTPALLAHELTHVRQWEADMLFPIRYSLASLRHGYRQNPYEVEAREVEALASRTQSGKDIT
jgi:hypothetical protein